MLFKARRYLDKKALPCLYYSYIHSYVNYANTTWCSTNRAYLKNFNKSMLLELSFTKTNLHIREIISKKIIY